MAETTRWDEIALPRPLRWFVCISGALTALCVGAEWIAHKVFHLRYPYNWPLMPAAHPFDDFSLFQDRFRHFHSPAFFAPGPAQYQYPPLPAVFFHLFFLAGPDATDWFIDALCAMYLVGIVAAGSALIKRGGGVRGVVLLLAVTALCSYPCWFELEQGNIEWIGCAIAGLGIWAALHRRGYTAAACFGIAGAMKIYPLVYVGLLVSRRRYRESAFAFLVAGAATLAGLWLVCPQWGATMRGVGEGFAGLRETYILGLITPGADHSFFSLIKSVMILVLHGPPPKPLLAEALRWYIPAAGVIAIVLFLLRIRHLPVVNQILSYALLMVLLPPVSYDYTLIQLYAPWLLLALLSYECRGRTPRGLTTALICLAGIFSAESEFIHHHRVWGAQIKAVTLLALLSIALRYRFVSSYDHEAESQSDSSGAGGSVLRTAST